MTNQTTKTERLSSDPEVDEEDSLEDYDVYKLDYEERDSSKSSNNGDVDCTRPVAAGGEILEVGDHIYVWCTLYQHHGIVLKTISETSPEDNTKEGSCSSKCILIAEFTNAALMLEDNMGFGGDMLVRTSGIASGASTNGVTGGFRFVWEMKPNEWHKVKYNANPIECVTWRAGTCSAATPSPVPTILARVNFLKDCRHMIPDYHVLESNCETVAVWCVTGTWETLQGGQALQWSTVGALSAAGLVPGIGIAAGGLALWHARHISQRWKDTAEQLEKDFQWYNLGRTPTYVFEA